MVEHFKCLLIITIAQIETKYFEHYITIYVYDILTYITGENFKFPRLFIYYVLI